MLCPHCNRKYKSEKKWVDHLGRNHGVTDPTLPETVHVDKNPSGCASNNRLISNERLKEAQRKRQIERDAKDAAEAELRKKFKTAVIDSESGRLEIQMRVKDHPGECVFCFDENTNAACVPCGHAYFHYDCLAEWVDAHKTCPFCREHVTMALKIYQ